MVRVGDTYVRSGACGDVGDYIVVDFAVVRVKPKIYSDIGVQGFKIGYCLFIDFGLGFVCVVFGPESDFVISGGVKFPGNGKGTLVLRAMTACKQSYRRKGSQGKSRKGFLWNAPGCFCLNSLILLYLLLKLLT